ncbi:hypothetical protein [Chryseobacterium taeanense]|uniref:hypothetical protein n=1 Tax=Chryseobacterium taeanense TaxID=311334 RepID=UPI001113C578|nr:hypothetical protein [Chryseobacterium taeanense]
MRIVIIQGNLIAWFRSTRKFHARVQQVFWCFGKLPAGCSTFSGIPESFLHSVAGFPEISMAFIIIVS